MGGVLDTGTGNRVYIPKLKPTRRMGLWLILLALLPFVAIFHSMQSRVELVPLPPSEFLEIRPEWNAERREAEAQMARAYWGCARATLQWKYPHGLSLPEKPLAEFQIDARSLSSALKLAPQSRDRYWQRLRKVWGLRQSWKEVRVWNFDWLTKPFEFWRGLKDKKD